MGSRVELQKLEGFTCVCNYMESADAKTMRRCTLTHKKIISSIIICCYSWLTYWARNSFEWWRLYDLSKWKKSFLSLFCLRSIIIHGSKRERAKTIVSSILLLGEVDHFCRISTCVVDIWKLRNQSNFSTKLRQNVFWEMFCPRGQNFGL